MSAPLSDAALDQLFRTARTRNGWKSDPLPLTTLQALYDLVKFGPTSANTSPARFIFVTSAAEREKLAALASGTNGAKIRQAPCTVIIGHDLDFLDRMPTLFPHNPTMLDGLKGTPMIEPFAFRNGSLQGAYLMIAARSLGLDCGPMSGFSNVGVDEAFFAGTNIKSNFICIIGHGTDENLFDRLPRLSFDEACKIV